MYEDFIKKAREQNEWKKHPEKWTRAEMLREEIIGDKKSNEEYLELQKEVIEFLRSDASDEDKKMIRGYTESLSMICNAIRDGILK